MPSDIVVAGGRRLVVVGATSFIAREIVRAAHRARLEVVQTRHDADLTDCLRAGDSVVCCGVDPRYRNQAYDPAHDHEARVAEAAAGAGAHTVMLSSRRVYPADERMGAVETSSAAGDGSAYGDNKARTEQRIRDISGDSAAILRLSNIFGREYEIGKSRGSFFGSMLGGLKGEGLITFDMNGATRRDFLPVDRVGRAVAACVGEAVSGIYNVGYGAGTACGDLAHALIEGYGRGRLVEQPVVVDEFYLNTTKWAARFGPLQDDLDLLDEARDIGRWLRNA